MSDEGFKTNLQHTMNELRKLQQATKNIPMESSTSDMPEILLKLPTLPELNTIDDDRKELKLLQDVFFRNIENEEIFNSLSALRGKPLNSKRSILEEYCYNASEQSSFKMNMKPLAISYRDGFFYSINTAQDEIISLQLESTPSRYAYLPNCTDTDLDTHQMTNCSKIMYSSSQLESGYYTLYIPNNI